MKVIASSLRKGNVIDVDGRLSDGVKVSERWRTTEQVEKATVDEREYDYLYSDGEGHHFMEPQTYEQLSVSDDVVGESRVFLKEGVKIFIKTFEGVAIAIELPQKVTLEITETEPVVKGQTASSSYKPAIVENGLRIMVPPHIGAGTKIIINTEDLSYVSRA